MPPSCALCIGQDTAASSLYGVIELESVCRGCETDAGSSGNSFKTPTVQCDCLKVGRDAVETYFQAVALHFGMA